MDETINIYITCGLPGSGKTTWAREFIEKNPNTIRICRDSIREMFCGSYKYDKKTEPIVKKAVIELLELAIENKYDVIIDETNIRREKREDWINILKMIEHEIYEKIRVQIIYFSLGIDLDSISGLQAVYGEENLNNRMSDDPRGYSKEHWKNVIDAMKKDFEIPEESEFPEDIKIIRID